jgi:hypothetical protein
VIGLEAIMTRTLTSRVLLYDNKKRLSLGFDGGRVVASIPAETEINILEEDHQEGWARIAYHRSNLTYEGYINRTALAEA